MVNNNAKELTRLSNDNNMLSLDVFMQIDLAPDNPVPESILMNTLFYSRQFDIFCKCVDLHRFEFQQITNHFTLLACGISAVEWRKLWMEKHPEIKPKTMMAVYYYQKARKF
jgi:hypothetical protein